MGCGSFDCESTIPLPLVPPAYSVSGDWPRILLLVETAFGYKSVHFINHARPFELFENVTPVCVEAYENSEPLTTFMHPENAVYVFGPEDGRVPQVIRRLCHRFVHIPSHFCLNLSAAVNVVLSHRLMSRQLLGMEPLLPLREMLHEVRGEVVTPTMAAVGWDGK